MPYTFIEKASLILINFHSTKSRNINMQYQIIHIVSNLVLICVYNSDFPNVIRLFQNKEPHISNSLWNIEDSGKGDNTFYICSDYCGTCLGNLRSPIAYDFIGADYKDNAIGQQLLWYYNETEKTISPAANSGLFITVKNIPDETTLPALELYVPLNNVTLQQFNLVLG